MPQDLIYITKFSSLTHSPLIYFIISHNTSSVADLFEGPLDRLGLDNIMAAHGQIRQKLTLQSYKQQHFV